MGFYQKTDHFQSCEKDYHVSGFGMSWTLKHPSSCSESDRSKSNRGGHLSISIDFFLQNLKIPDLILCERHLCRKKEKEISFSVLLKIFVTHNPCILMDYSNHTLLTEFVFLGFSNITHGQVYLVLLFLTIYLVTILGNFMIITLILMDSHLHSPMYFFLSHLSCSDVCYSTVTVPKILANLLLQRHTISYNHCLTQMFFLIGFTGSECWLLAIMAYDRYAAICQPLRYSHLMSPHVCMTAATMAWIWGFLDATVHTALASNFHFCGHNQIHHIFCDLPPLLKIACGDKFVSEITIHVATVFVGLGPFLLMVISYFYILASVLRIRSNTGRHKAFSTCISHVTVVLLYFGNGSVNYNQPSAGYSLETDTLISTMYCIVTPMVNPLIYSLCNQEVKGALRKVLEKCRRI